MILEDNIEFLFLHQSQEKSVKNPGLGLGWENGAKTGFFPGLDSFGAENDQFPNLIKNISLGKNHFSCAYWHSFYLDHCQPFAFIARIGISFTPS